MKRSILICLAVAAFSSNAAMASADLAKAKNCMSCHGVANKIIGPSFKDIATKYAGDKTAEAKLAAKVISGGGGAWGVAVMPPHPQVSPAESATLVKWILATK